jgi:hypothetical protein
MWVREGFGAYRGWSDFRVQYRMMNAYDGWF